MAFSLLCFFIFPVFTPAIAASLVGGAIGGSVALISHAPRTAVVSFLFAIAPLAGFLLTRYMSGSGYIGFLALGLAVVSAALM